MTTFSAVALLFMSHACKPISTLAAMHLAIPRIVNSISHGAAGAYLQRNADVEPGESGRSSRRSLSEVRRAIL